MLYTSKQSKQTVPCVKVKRRRIIMSFKKNLTNFIRKSETNHKKL